VRVVALALIALIASFPNASASAQKAQKDQKAKKEKKLERPIATIETNKGVIIIELEPTDAPIAVSNFIALVQRGFYNGLSFHRIEDWVAQGGDPKGNGSGGPGYTIKNDNNRALKHIKGSVGMANAGRDTGGSQFYLLKKDAPSLDNGNYTLFGRITNGQEVVEKLLIGDRMEKITVQLPEKFKLEAFGASRRAEPENLAYPNLPVDAATREFSRTVRVRAEVSVQGTANLTLVRGSGDGEIDTAILKALGLWKWSPALRDGQPLAQTQEFEYDLVTHSRRYDKRGQR
jgi:peptidyl-prolyl cis-trans isomerase B (cyclophilin B)